MGRIVWNTIKQSKNFYVRTYRLTGSLLALSFSTTLLLITGIIYTFINISPIDFYATNSEHHPITLQPMDQPNYSAQALLGDEIETDRKPETNQRALAP